MKQDNMLLIERLEKSKTIQKWIKFYKEWFDLTIDLMRFIELIEPQGPGYTTIMLPEEVTFTKCVEVFSQKLKFFACDIAESDIKPKQLRWESESYVSYDRGRPSKMVELLVFDLFQLYLGKSILPKCETHPFNGNGASTIEGKQILVHVTTGHAMLRVNHEKGERNEKDVAYEVFTLSS